MSLIYGVKQVMHRIRVKLYPNYLPTGGAWLTRTDSEATLNIEQVCAAMRERGGFKGDLRELIENVKRYNDEVAYQLCDGYTINNGYFSIYPNLGGTLKTPHEKPAHDKNPLSFRFRPHKALRELVESIEINVEGIAESDGYIDEFMLHEGSLSEVQVNSYWIAEHAFTIRGGKIKIEGDDPGCGVYFVRADGSAGEEKVSVYIENNPSSIRGIVPVMPCFGACRIEIRTQHSGSGNTLKNIRTISSPFILEQG